MLARSVCIVRNVKKNESLSVSVKVLIRPMIRSRKAEPIGVFKTGCQRSADALRWMDAQGFGLEDILGLVPCASISTGATMRYGRTRTRQRTD
jgi:hypothetical protein